MISGYSCLLKGGLDLPRVKLQVWIVPGYSLVSHSPEGSKMSSSPAGAGTPPHCECSLKKDSLAYQLKCGGANSREFGNLCFTLIELVLCSRNGSHF